MKNIFPREFNGVEIRQDERGNVLCVDLGEALQYGGPKGGNLSRNFSHVQLWTERFEEGVDFFRDRKGRIWLSPDCARSTVYLIAAIERPDRRELAQDLIHAIERLSSRRRVRAA